MTRTETVEESELAEESPTDACPGLLLVHSALGPSLVAAAVRESGIEIGRSTFGGVRLVDDRMSRRHARVSCDGVRWTITDLESRNGTFVDGERVEGKVVSDAPKVIRVGRSLFIPVPDVRAFEGKSVERRGEVWIGPTLAEAWEKIERAARFGDALHVSGESGAGKELAARAFHDRGPRALGPFIAVNCAAIPEELAERLLFGTRKGAYSGATADADGYVQAADHGTLFLDEVAELSAPVQAKLLRVLESKEVLALGASKPRAVDVRVCSATHDLRGRVAAGSFREDLYFRIGRPEVLLPPLRERREEIPFLITAELAKLERDLRPHTSLVEACLVRTWPGNVRELLGEIRRAGHESLSAGEDKTVDVKCLGDAAGIGFATLTTSGAPGAESGKPTAQPMPDKETIEAALKAEAGNVTRAARALGIHRNQLRRWLAKNGQAGSSDSGASDG